MTTITSQRAHLGWHPTEINEILYTLYEKNTYEVKIIFWLGWVKHGVFLVATILKYNMAAKSSLFWYRYLIGRTPKPWCSRWNHTDICTRTRVNEEKSSNFWDRSWRPFWNPRWPQPAASFSRRRSLNRKVRTPEIYFVPNFVLLIILICTICPDLDPFSLHNKGKRPNKWVWPWPYKWPWPLLKLIIIQFEGPSPITYI